MQLAAFAFDYDGTLARDGCVEGQTVEALMRLKAAGLRLLLITGRQLPELQQVFPRYALFDAIVAENGALLSRPALSEERALCPTPPPVLLEALARRHVQPLAVGRSIIATWRPNEIPLLEAIRECGLEWQIIFNKDAVMCLPPGVNKATGLQAALAALQISPLNVLAVGDAENDHAMLAACGYRAAVANAIEALKKEADIVTRADHGAGVVELIERFLSDPARAITAEVSRHDINIGKDAAEREVAIRPGATVLIAGASGAGKSRLTTLLIERFVERGFQLCIVDPEGEYEQLARLTMLGDAKSCPSLEEAGKLLREPQNNVSLNLLAVDMESRPKMLASLTTLIDALRVQAARPHWLMVDEAHHTIPDSLQPALLVEPRHLSGTVLVTTDPCGLSRKFLETIGIVIAVGEKSPRTLSAFCEVLQLSLPQLPEATPTSDHALYWDRTAGPAVRLALLDEPSQSHLRHVRKYAQGALSEEESFYFRGPESALRLRAQNLSTFLQMAEGVDDASWLYHLGRSDYSRWFRGAIKDPELATEAETLERRFQQDPHESRRAMRELITSRYTAAAP